MNQYYTFDQLAKMIPKICREQRHFLRLSQKNVVEKLEEEKGIIIHKAYVGNYFTSLEMKGVTLTLMKLDDELKECVDMPADSMGLKQL